MKIPIVTAASDFRKNSIVRLSPILFTVLAWAPFAMSQTVNVVQTNPDQSALLTPQESLIFTNGTASQLAHVTHE